jgi:hypothetical protein
MKESKRRKNFRSSKKLESIWCKAFCLASQVSKIKKSGREYHVVRDIHEYYYNALVHYLDILCSQSF